MSVLVEWGQLFKRVHISVGLRRGHYIFCGLGSWELTNGLLKQNGVPTWSWLHPPKTWENLEWNSRHLRKKFSYIFFFQMGSAWWWHTTSHLRSLMDCRRLTHIKRAICFILCTDLKISVIQKQLQNILKIKFKQIFDWLMELSSR